MLVARWWHCVSPWTVARQAALSTGFSRWEHSSGLPRPPPGDLPHPGIEPVSPALQVYSLLSEPPGKPEKRWTLFKKSWDEEVQQMRGPLTVSLAGQHHSHVPGKATETWAQPLGCAVGNQGCAQPAGRAKPSRGRCCPPTVGLRSSPLCFAISHSVANLAFQPPTLTFRCYRQKVPVQEDCEPLKAKVLC